MAIDSFRAQRAEDAEAKFGDLAADGIVNNFVLMTAAGKVLGSCLYEPLPKLLEKWNNLPEEERGPGRVHVPELGRRDSRWAWADPPPGGLALKVFIHNLERTGGTELIRGKSLYPVSWPSVDVIRDSLWITQVEWQEMVPRNPKTGDTLAVPRTLRNRIFQFCLCERYRTVNRPWLQEEIRSGELKMSVAEVSGANVRLRLEGGALIATDPNYRKAKAGFEGVLLGYLNYNRQQKTFTRFDLIALGDNWWNEKEEGLSKDFTALSKVILGKITVGVAFELATPGSGFHHVAPGSFWSWSKRNDYFGTNPLPVSFK